MWACLSHAYERRLRPKQSQHSFPTKQLFVLGKFAIRCSHTISRADGTDSQRYAAYANLLPLCPSSLTHIA
jgi:hypothetical protein